MGANQMLPIVGGDPENVTVSTPAIPSLPMPKPKSKRKRPFNKSLCWCGCGSRKNRKRKYAPGHSAYARYRFIFGSKS